MKFSKVISIVLLCVLLISNVVLITGCQKQPEKPDIPIVAEPYEPESEPEPEPQPTYATLSFTGDVLIHKSVYSAAHIEGKEYDFSPYFSLVDHVFDSDINIANMEGPVDAEGDNKDIDTYPCFNAPIQILDALKGININTLFTSNNHSYDKGRDGCVRTRQNIIDKGFDAIGTYETPEQAETPYVKEVNGIKIGIVAFTDSTNGLKIAKEYADYTLHHVALNDKGIERMKEKVQQLRDAGAEYIITSFHWGAEYIDEPLGSMKKVAQALADYGVDLIIDNHSHCVQPIEKKTVTYNGVEKECIVVYSLGNFFANQTETKNGHKTQFGMVVKMKLKKTPEGVISVDEASYTPTFMYYNPKADKKDRFRVVVAGEYADAAEKPEFFLDNAAWGKCAKAVEHVKKIVGTDIECKEKLK